METKDPVPEGSEPRTTAAPRRRLTRTPNNKVIAGVAGGLGAYFDVDPLLFRVGFIALTFVGGTGLLAYLVAWFLTPLPTEPVSRGERFLARVGGAPPWLAILLLVVAAIVLAGSVTAWDGGVLWALALIALGVLLLQQDREAPAPAGTDPPEAPAIPPSSYRTETVTVPAESAKPRPRSPLGLYTIAAGLLAIGALALLDNFGVVDPGVGHYFALGLTVVGAGLVVGSLWGRAYSMILLGVLLLPATSALSLIEAPFEGGLGEAFFTPQSADEVRDEYRLAGGELRLDLTELERSSEPVELDASVSLGELNVVVPAGASTVIDAHAGAGKIVLFGHETDGADVDQAYEPNEATDPDFRLDLEVGFGTVHVEAE
jgi:phage shock protein PspC (stress-responsive transcriptional regulator)